MELAHLYPASSPSLQQLTVENNQKRAFCFVFTVTAICLFALWHLYYPVMCWLLGHGVALDGPMWTEAPWGSLVPGLARGQDTRWLPRRSQMLFMELSTWTTDVKIRLYCTGAHCIYIWSPVLFQFQLKMNCFLTPTLRTQSVLVKSDISK